MTPSSAGIVAASGSVSPPAYVSGATVFRNATDSKAIKYEVSAGTWTDSGTFTYDFHGVAGGGGPGLLLQSGSSNSYNAGTDLGGDSWYCYIKNTNGAGTTSQLIGNFGSNYPSANPNVWP